MLYSLRDVTEFKKQKSAIGTHTQKNRNKGDKSGKDERDKAGEAKIPLRNLENEKNIEKTQRKGEETREQGSMGGERERKGINKEIITFTPKVKPKDS